MMNRRWNLLFALLFVPFLLLAGEGMWIPLLLKKYNEADMKARGMQMSAEDIYSINSGSLKDAIVHFGGFCTGEIISSKGLILTNHHCGYGSIQSHSTVDHNYLKDGFWSRSHSEELPNPGLFATFIIRIEDVTARALENTDGIEDPDELQSIIDQNLANIRNTTQREEYQDITIKPFFKGNQYFLFVTETYNDIRLVGTPPENIGKFGSDTDNWVWPRHTGDFSLFRVYAGQGNMPASYAPDNQPLQPRHHLPVSLDGVAEDDFTLVFGFPGRTDEYLPATAVEQIVDYRNPARIKVRDEALKILDGYMRQDPAIKLKYASKYASTANYWKKWIGERLGIQRTGGIARKTGFEQVFIERIGEKQEWLDQYGNLLPELNTLYHENTEYQVASDYFSEVFGRNAELMRIASYCVRLASQYSAGGDSGYLNYKKRLENFFTSFYKDYDADIDKVVFEKLMDIYLTHVSPSLISEETAMMGKDRASLASEIYASSALTSWESLKAVIDLDPEAAVEALAHDPAVLWYNQVYNDMSTLVQPKLSASLERIQTLEKVYMAALLDVFPERNFYPDANSTLRVTYGHVKGYTPRDGVEYQPVTYLDGVMEKYVPGDYEFDVSDKLIELYNNKDYGKYGEHGKMPVCFIGTNHTTGGNSGSPAIDAYGNLIGLNFDRVWEGTMSDYNYDASICRNIMVDARYILFIIDKFGGAGHLVDEMDLVHPKKK